MTLLPILYWIILILAVIGVFAPANWLGGRLNGLAATVLFIIIGLRIFRIPLQ